MKIIEPSVTVCFVSNAYIPYNTASEELVNEEHSSMATDIAKEYGLALVKHIERCGRTCYLSEPSSTSTERFIKNLIKRGHESVLEHGYLTLEFICDRGVSHELVRHRMASYSQESTRYCNYSSNKFDNQITVIKPEGLTDYEYDIWKSTNEMCESAYLDILKNGGTPERARSVLTNSLKTKIVMTANCRELRHFFKLRCSPKAHPNMVTIACIALKECHNLIPYIFDDIYEEVFGHGVE